MRPDPRLVAYEANLGALSAVMGEQAWADVHSAPDATWVLSEIPFGWANAVCGVRLDASSADARIAEIVGAYRTARRRTRWYLLPMSTPPDLADRLAASGLEPEYADDAMACDLAAWNPPSGAKGITVERVEDLATFHTWVDTYALAYGSGRRPADEIFERCWTDVAIERGGPIATYLGRLDGVPVATAFGCSDDGVVGIFAVGTVPAARRRGVGSAVTAQLMADARDAGARLAVLWASDIGQSVYARLGFEAIGQVRTAVGRFDLEP
jgi:GNAT superfamily N-acetyltransferase